MSEDQALGQLSEILARPEYHVDQSVPWWQQLLQPLLDFLWNLGTQLYQLIIDSATGREGELGSLAVLASLALLAGAAVYLVRTVRLAVVHETALRTASLAQRRERSDQLWQSAQQLAAAGRLSEAVRLLYLSTLYALDERAVLHIEQSLTNREYARELLELHPALGDSFTALVDAYEQVRYGRAPVGAQTFEALTARADRVRSAALRAAST